MNEIAVAVPGSCGELVQGEIDGVRFHVSCPINKYSRATLMPARGEREVNMPGRKSRAAIDAVVGRSRREWVGSRIRLETELSSGVGMAGSTADIGAIATVAALASGRRLTQTQLAQLAVSIEPTDATLIRGVCAFDHQSGRYLEPLGPAPQLAVSYVETGGTVDTVEFNTRKIRYTTSQKKKLRLAFAMVRTGIKRCDWSLVGLAATISARINQEILPKPRFESVVEIARNHRAYGVIVAHSGTLAGILHDRQDRTVAHSLGRLGFSGAETSNLVGGGARLCR